MSGSVRQANDQSAIFRAKLGIWLITVSAAGLLVLGIATLIGAGLATTSAAPTLFKDTAQTLLSTLLPLFGTWVGTVLAFYFSKENFEAASTNALNVLRATGMEKLRSMSVSQGMIPRGRMVVVLLPAGGTLGALALATVDQAFTQLGVNGQRISRLVILDSGGAFAAVLHRSIWVEMVNQGQAANPAITVANGTFGQLAGLPLTGIKDMATYNDVVTRAVAYAGASQTLADAKVAMEAAPYCQDVMVTQSGAAGTPVIGWITNVDLGRLSEA